MNSNAATKSEARKPACDDYADGNFSTIVRSNQNWLRAAARRRLGGNALADDAVQSVFIALWSRYEPPYSDESRLRSWLATTIRHTCSNLRRDQRRQLAHLQRLADTRLGGRQPDADAWADGEQIAALDAALRRLSPTDRDLVMARFYQGQSVREVAQQFGIREAAAETRIRRAVDRLRAIMLRQRPWAGARSLAVLPLALRVTPDGSKGSFAQGTAMRPAALSRAIHAIRKWLASQAHISITVGVLSAFAAGTAMAALVVAGALLFRSPRPPDPSVASGLGGAPASPAERDAQPPLQPRRAGQEITQRVAQPAGWLGSGFQAMARSARWCRMPLLGESGMLDGPNPRVGRENRDTKLRTLRPAEGQYSNYPAIHPLQTLVAGNPSVPAISIPCRAGQTVPTLRKTAPGKKNKKILTGNGRRRTYIH